MTELPSSFIDRTRRLLGDDYPRFEQALATESPVSIRLNPAKCWPGRPLGEAVPWSQEGYYLPERPALTLDTCFHAGAYYVQEAASMFLHRVIDQYIHTPVRYLDLCAAPGGKSTDAIASLPAGSLVVSNEVVPNRTYILAENLTKWGSPFSVVTLNEAAYVPRLERQVGYRCALLGRGDVSQRPRRHCRVVACRGGPLRRTPAANPHRRVAGPQAGRSAHLQHLHLQPRGERRDGALPDERAGSHPAHGRYRPGLGHRFGSRTGCDGLPLHAASHTGRRALHGGVAETRRTRRLALPAARRTGRQTQQKGEEDHPGDSRARRMVPTAGSSRRFRLCVARRQFPGHPPRIPGRLPVARPAPHPAAGRCHSGYRQGSRLHSPKRHPASKPTSLRPWPTCAARASCCHPTSRADTSSSPTAVSPSGGSRIWATGPTTSIRRSGASAAATPPTSCPTCLSNTYKHEVFVSTTRYPPETETRVRPSPYPRPVPVHDSPATTWEPTPGSYPGATPPCGSRENHLLSRH